MVPKKVFLEVDGFCVKFQLAFGDVDLCLRIRQLGYRVLYTPFARLVHHESVSRGRHIPTSDLIEGYEGFLPNIIEGDPYFNPNLSYRKLVPDLSTRNEDRVAFLKHILSRRLAVE
jgi:GT2 family glycosyltransferase